MFFFRHSATVDVKRNIYDLAVNKYGSQIAIVENQGGYDSIQESVVRVYSVGRKKMVEDEVEEDDNDMEMSDEASGSDNESDGKLFCFYFFAWVELECLVDFPRN